MAEYILDPEGASEKLGSKVTIALEADTVVSYRTCGGGGYGSPLQRDPAAVAADVREGKVSAERAREIYGVVIEDGMVNAAATAALRKERGDGV